MGKKRIIQKTKEELIKEREQIDAAVGKEPRTGSGRHQVLGARIYISSSYNNTLMTLCDNKGNTISQVSAGEGSSRGYSAIRSLAARGLEIDRLKDMTPIPHNGCRRPKVRRV
ncbi:MAG: 30S ribosomal protein S11 [Parcubacteria group bacterium GW2011_GWA2_47_9]|nr:MAG: 30S ribosomal protein S11 [Parcubacteria group bacterium GW2011_GWA2_47_9]